MNDTRFLIKKVFEILHENNLDYCVQNKYEMMPDEMPSDIDMFYRNASEKDLDRIVKQICDSTGTIITQKIATGYYQFTYNLSYSEINTRFQFQLDFYRELSSSKFPHVYIAEEMLNSKRYYNNLCYIPNPPHEACYLVIRRVMKKDMNESHLSKIYTLFNNEKNQAVEILSNYWGEEINKEILSAIENKNISYFKHNIKKLRNRLSYVSNKQTTTVKRIKSLYFQITKFIPYRIFCPVGISIALLSPDGGGKSTIISKLKDSCSGSFDIEYKYFRPGLFKNIGQYKPNAQPESGDNPDPHGKRPNGILKSFIRFFIYNIDFSLGYLLLVWPAKIKRKLVIFDRYYYDYYADIYRYHYSFSKRVPRLFSFMIPSPDLVFVLDAPAEVLFNRKKELEIDEIERQRKSFLDFSKKRKNTFVINVDRSIDDIVKEITSYILITKHKKVQRIIK